MSNPFMVGDVVEVLNKEENHGYKQFKPGDKLVVTDVYSEYVNFNKTGGWLWDRFELVQRGELKEDTPWWRET